MRKVAYILYCIKVLFLLMGNRRAMATRTKGKQLMYLKNKKSENDLAKNVKKLNVF